MAIDTQLISTIPKVCTDDWSTPAQMVPDGWGLGGRRNASIKKSQQRKEHPRGEKSKACYNTVIKQRVRKCLQIGNVGIFIQCGNCAVILLCKLLKLNVLTLGIYWHACLLVHTVMIRLGLSPVHGGILCWIFVSAQLKKIWLTLRLW